MAWVSVPELAVEESMQHYEPLALGRIRFSAGDFAAALELDRDGIIRGYEGLAEGSPEVLRVLVLVVAAPPVVGLGLRVAGR
jgi:hypothetical protein